MGAEGARDRALARGLETLRQKDYREPDLWRDGVVTEGVSPLRKTSGNLSGKRTGVICFKQITPFCLGKEKLHLLQETK